MTIPTLETDRLLLRAWQESDYQPVSAYYSDPEMTEYLGGVQDAESAFRQMATYLGHWHLFGFGYWAVEEKSSHAFVGGCGLWKSPQWPEIELGYWLLPEFHGTGMALEAAQVAKDFAFNTLNLNTLVSYIDATNVSSIRLAEKLGAKAEPAINLLNFGPHLVYRYHD